MKVVFEIVYADDGSNEELERIVSSIADGAVRVAEEWVKGPVRLTSRYAIEDGADGNGWRTGDPPDFGWYLVSVKLPWGGEFVQEAYFKDGRWAWDSPFKRWEYIDTPVDGSWPIDLASDPCPVSGWQPLPAAMNQIKMQP